MNSNLMSLKVDRNFGLVLLDWMKSDTIEIQFGIHLTILA